MSVRIAILVCFLSSAWALKNGDNWRPKEAWKRISAGKSSPRWWEPFSLDGLIKAKDGERNCWWLNQQGGHTSFKMSTENRVAGLVVSDSGSEAIIKMLDSMADPNQGHVRRKEKDMSVNADCVLGEIQNKYAQRVIVPLRDPVQRIIAGIEQRIHLHEHWVLRNNKMARKTFNHNFKSVDQYLNALRDVDDNGNPGNGTAGMHKRAMAVTHAHDSLNFMLPVKGYYIRDGDTTASNVKFVCSCKLAQEVEKVSDEWGLKVDDEMPETLQDSELTISPENRKWIEKTYIADVKFYKEHCDATCGDGK